MSSTTLAIVGSRNFPDRAAVEAFVARLKPTTKVISGAARGVDSWAAEAARARGLDVEEFPADWNAHGRAAGFKRNAVMVERADQVVAFWDGRSRGTQHSIGLARKAGKLYAVYGPDTPSE